ncbi:type II toxin-antitoxin system HicA family toxin [Fischerella thermalis]|uniref:type II toxin-antitoxin system HicA family toxin n=1 Tax=Fischerella thermalis TaxID=372787 RepID=UPI0027E41A96|nr:type II toxin-antitoxin system HicA family toxin [Fischerella thermalis]
MGSALPVLSGREVVRVFESLGWEVVRQTGSHIIMTKTKSLSRFRFLITAKWRKELCEV